MYMFIKSIYTKSRPPSIVLCEAMRIGSEPVLENLNNAIRSICFTFLTTLYNPIKCVVSCMFLSSLLCINSVI